jgi:hypothetical protein
MKLRHTLPLVAVAALIGCGGSDEPAPRPDAASSSPSAYCRLVADLERRGAQAFAEAERDGDPARIAGIERGFAAGAADDLDRLGRVAPAPIRADVRTILAAMRERAGLTRTGPGERAAAGAEERVKAFERRAC